MFAKTLIIAALLGLSQTVSAVSLLAQSNAEATDSYTLRLLQDENPDADDTRQAVDFPGDPIAPAPGPKEFFTEILVTSFDKSAADYNASDQAKKDAFNRTIGAETPILESKDAASSWLANFDSLSADKQQEKMDAVKQVLLGCKNSATAARA